MRFLVAVAALSLGPALGAGQGPPGTNLVVDVRVAAVSMRGDTTEVTYVLRNNATSAERLFGFTVDAPSPVRRISRPEPQENWLAEVAYATRSVAAWGALGQQMMPGQESPPLEFEAVGLPAIVTSWVEGYYPPSTEIPSDTLPLEDPMVGLEGHSVRGSTVGVEPFPSDLGGGNLLLRLRGLLDQSCGDLGWISNALVCATLGANLDNARQAVSQGDAATARNHLTIFLTQLEAEHAGGVVVNDSAYWLLKVNGEFIHGRL